MCLRWFSATRRAVSKASRLTLLTEAFSKCPNCRARKARKHSPRLPGMCLARYWYLLNRRRPRRRSRPRLLWMRESRRLPTTLKDRERERERGRRRGRLALHGAKHMPGFTQAKRRSYRRHHRCRLRRNQCYRTHSRRWLPDRDRGQGLDRRWLFDRYCPGQVGRGFRPLRCNSC